MKLNLLDIEKFIKDKRLLEVKNSKLPSNSGYEKDSLWATGIFGFPGNKSRKEMFGYINLRRNFIHPSVLDLIKTCSEETSRIVLNKSSYIVRDGVYVEDSSGETGIPFLINSLEDVDLTLFCKKEKADVAKFLEENKKKILISKWLVIPAGYRDIDLSRKDAARTSSEINTLYTQLIYLRSKITGDEYMDNAIIIKVQKILQSINAWIRDKNLKGKNGLFRDKMLKKSMDYSTRLVLTSSPEIPVGYIGVV